MEFWRFDLEVPLVAVAVVVAVIVVVIVVVVDHLKRLLVDLDVERLAD